MKKSNSILLLLIASLILVSFSYTNSEERNPILIRHDKEEAEFFKLAERFEKYMCHINLPDCEGTIIADQWAISAAHCVIGIAEKFNSGEKHFVIVNGVEIEVDKVVMYKEWESLLENDSILHNMAIVNDIALLHLKTKPNDALKAKLYVDEDELDKLVYMVGKGDKGDGLIGVNGNDGKQRGATNRIETVSDKWITWTFDHPDTRTKYLTEFEGISGPGDSGGPAFILKNDTVYLAGISSWQDVKGGDEGLYGVTEHYARVSKFINWIHEEMAGNSSVSNDILRVESKPDAVDTRPKAIYVHPNTLKQYVGEYEYKKGGVTIKIYTEGNGTKLFTSVPEQPPYELVPTGEHKFTFKTLQGFKIEFKNAENGVFKTLIGIQPEGTYTAVRN